MTATRTTAGRRQIDLTLARTLQRLRDLHDRITHHHIAVRVPPRTRTPGPNTYAHMSTGHLAVAALAGAAIYHWSQQEQQFFDNELAARGFDESLAAWHGQTLSPTEVDEHTPTPRFDTTVETLRVITAASLDTLAEAIDEVILGDDGRIPGALSPAEVVEDMSITGMETDAIAAYETGVGTSTASLTDAAAAQQAAPAASVVEEASDHLIADDGLTL